MQFVISGKAKTVFRLIELKAKREEVKRQIEERKIERLRELENMMEGNKQGGGQWRQKLRQKRIMITARVQST
jgi:hypothetical protein